MAPMSFPGTRPASIPMARATLRAVSASRAVFFIASGLIYALAIALATLTLHAYFSQTWDVVTFIHAARALLDGNSPFDLYARSRAAQTWPYAYPPLHAFVVALALGVGDAVRVLPDFLWARVPPLLADIGCALALYAILRRKTDDERLARTGALLWLFNPVTFYDTAVQGHFESEWLLFVLLAYASFETSRSTLLPSLALAVAVLFKQIAIVFAIPLWVMSLADNRWRSVVVSVLLFGLVVSAVSLPFLLYSDDFLYMNFTYVENVPVQTQSWIVAVLGLTRASPDALTSDFFLLRYATFVTLLVTAALAFVGARRGWSVYLVATFIALAFFLTSKKVMGYYYVMLLPFLFAEVLPTRRWRVAGVAIVATAWISLSPYYAAWTNHAHWWLYAALGTAHSAFFVWLWVRLLVDDAHGGDAETPAVGQRSAIVTSTGLFAGGLFAALGQPLACNTTSPIRAPILTPGTEGLALVAFGGLVALLLVTLAIATRATRAFGVPLPRAAWGIVLIFAPLYFSVYYLTKESTAIFEIALKVLGV